MKKISLAMVVLAIVAALLAQRSVAEDPPREQTTQHDSPEQMQAMMEQWAKLMQPSEGHKRLEYFVGKWNIAIRTWWGGPGSQAAETKGTSETKSILGGRYIMDTVHSQLMMPGADGKMTPTPFEGLGMTGFDNHRQMYTNTWADTMGTSMHINRGNCNPSGTVFTYYGEMDEPGLAIGKMVKTVIRIVNQDKYVFEMYDLYVSDDYKVLEITYSRQQ